MRVMIPIDETRCPKFRDFIRDAKLCPRCHNNHRHIEGRFSINIDPYGNYFSSTSLAIVCEECGHVHEYRKFERLSDKLAEGLKELLTAGSDA